ncbi:MAG: HAD family phosphatase [Lachnospiraceae bacterium]|nr:HAD family phosphatase [Lachnospiraceae bacterium]
MLKYVLFDMDGTILDTEKIYHKVEMEAAGELGFDFFTHDDAYDMRSLYSAGANELMEERYGGRFDYFAYHDLTNIKFDVYINEHGIPLKPGIFEILEYLKEKNIPTSIVTATRMDRAQKNLSETGLEGHFNDLISAHEVTLGKPHPDPYLFACEKLGIKPEEALCVEDSPNGVRSGAAAGCITVMIPDLTEPTEDIIPLCHAVVPSLISLKDVIDDLM